MEYNQMFKILPSKGKPLKKGQPTKWEKIFANDMTDKGLFAKHKNKSFNSTTKNQRTQ